MKLIMLMMMLSSCSALNATHFLSILDLIPTEIVLGRMHFRIMALSAPPTAALEIEKHSSTSPNTRMREIRRLESVLKRMLSRVDRLSPFSPLSHGFNIEVTKFEMQVSKYVENSFFNLSLPDVAYILYWRHEWSIQILFDLPLRITYVPLTRSLEDTIRFFRFANRRVFQPILCLKKIQGKK